jgi:peptidyl-Asp metalloendopeptidase
MNVSRSKLAQIVTNISISILILSVASVTVQAAREDYQSNQNLFSPAFTPGSLTPSQDQTQPRYVNVDISLLDKAEEGDAIGLNLYDDVYFTAILNHKEAFPQDGYSWIGSLENVNNSQVILVVGNRQVAGNITSPEGFYQVRYAGEGIHAIYTVDQSTFPAEAAPISVNAGLPDESDTTVATDLCNSIDVMVVWTPAARIAAGGTSAMQNLVNLAVIETNQSYSNSGIVQRINLVHSQEVNYTESGDFGTDIARLQNPYDGIIDNVHSLRNTYFADLVSMFIEGTQYCGIGYLMNPVSHNFESNAFTVVARTCATGYYTFAHEMGHNEGAHHDWYSQGADLPPYEYAHGFVNVTGRWRTIMAYDNQCNDLGFYCTRIQYWSNPNITYGGQPIGIPVGYYHPADNHLTLNNTCSTVANFRDRPDSLPTLTKLSPANATKKLPRKLTLTWSNISEVLQYEYCYDKKNNNKCDSRWINGSYGKLDRLSGGTVYYWQVRATLLDGRIIYADNETWWWFKTKR